MLSGRCQTRKLLIGNTRNCEMEPSRSLSDFETSERSWPAGRKKPEMEKRHDNHMVLGKVLRLYLCKQKAALWKQKAAPQVRAVAEGCLSTPAVGTRGPG